MIDHEDIEQINQEEGNRFYMNRKKSLIKYPSVSTLISWADCESRVAIAAWREKKGAEEAQKITQKYANAGTSIHASIEGSDKELSKNDQKKKDFHNRLIESMEIQSTEKRILWVSPEDSNVGFGGTFDCLAKVNKSYLLDSFDNCLGANGEASFMIVDWKNVRQIRDPSFYLKYYLQLAAYIAGVNRATDKRYEISEGMISLTTSRTHKILYLSKREIKWYWKSFKEIAINYAYQKTFDWHSFASASRSFYDSENELINSFMPQVLFIRK